MFKPTTWKVVSVIITALVIVNAYLVLRTNEVIEKSYYLNKTQLAVSDTHTKELKKEGILSASNHIRIASDIQNIEEVFIKRGETIMEGQELARYRSDAVETEQQKLEIELQAYESELSELESILYDLEDESGYSSPSTSTDSTSLGTAGFWNLDLTLELGIDQNTPTAEGEAIISRHIAETQRQIDILNNRLSSLETDQALASPTSGVVGDIFQEGDTITFILYPEEKAAIVYVDEEQWQRVALEQAAQIVIRAGEEDEWIVDGTVTEKQQIPAAKSIWYKEMKKHKKIDPSETLYEVQVTPLEYIDNYPFGEKVDVTIITNEEAGSFIAREDWVIDYEIEDIGDTHIYTLGYDGRTRLTPVNVAFDKKGIIEEPVREDLIAEEPLEEIVEEELETEVETKPEIITVDFTEKEVVEEEKEELYDVTVFTGAIEDYTVLLDGKPRNIYAPTFRPYPIEKFTWDEVGPLTWQDVVFFAIQP